MDFWTFVFLTSIVFCLTHIVSRKIRTNERNGYGDEDTRVTQETFSGLQRLEQRVEALETLLIDQERASRADRVAAEIESL